MILISQVFLRYYVLYKNKFFSNRFFKLVMSLDCGVKKMRTQIRLGEYGILYILFMLDISH